MDWRIEDHRVAVHDENGRLLAEITFPETALGTVDIQHTFVDASLRGQGMAGLLMEKAVECIREKGWKARTSCSYAAAWREKHPEHSALFV